MAFRASYNSREAFQPQTFSYSNLGTKWTFNWLSYLTDDPSNVSAAVTVYLPGGGQETAMAFNSGTNSYGVTSRQQAVPTTTGRTGIATSRAASSWRRGRIIPRFNINTRRRPRG